MYRTLTLRLVERQRLACLCFCMYSMCTCCWHVFDCTCSLHVAFSLRSHAQAGCDHGAVLCRISARLWIRCKLRVTWPHAVTCFIEAHGFWLWHLILGSSGNTSMGPLAVTTALQTLRDLLVYSNPSGSELSNQAAAVSQAESVDLGSGTERQWMRKKDWVHQKIGRTQTKDERPRGMGCFIGSCPTGRETSTSRENDF